MTEAISVDIPGAAQLVGVSTEIIRRAINTTGANPLRAKKVGSKYVVQVEDLRAWVAGLPNA